VAGAKFIDNSAVVLRRIGTNSEQAMKDAAELLVEAVQEKILYGYKDVHGTPPHTEIVDTGRLFDSIGAEVRRDSQNAYSTMVGANTTYARYVHDGTSKLKGRPFVRDGVMDSQKSLQRLLSTDLSAGFDK
jgi:HK97 gp10 family phage protein